MKANKKKKKKKKKKKGQLYAGNSKWVCVCPDNQSTSAEL